MGQVVVVEVRPGEGGDDAHRFAVELLDAVSAAARRRGVRVERVSSARTYTLRLFGQVLGDWEWLAGVHRVQRIPRNDKAGRRHTSTATVAVLGDAGARDVLVGDDDVEVTVARGSGPGGQHRNKTETKVTVRHKPTGTVVTVNRGRSQWENRQKARRELERRLTRDASNRHDNKVDERRADQISTGMRSAKTFTYSAQRNTVVDHGTGREWKLDRFMNGRF